MKLKDAFRLKQTDRIALVGAGGKSSTLFALAKDYSGPVILTTTTHLASAELAHADQVFEVNTIAEIESLLSRLEPSGKMLFYSVSQKEKRAGGLSNELQISLKKYADLKQIPVIIEADGSRRVGMKAPYEYEPPIPDWVTSVIVVCGLENLGKKASADTIYNLDAFLSLSGLAENDVISSEGIINVLCSPIGGLKNIPANAEKNVFLNQWDTQGDALSAAVEQWRPLLAGFDRVVIGSAGRISGESQVATRIENVAAIILAAGGSKRFGQPKQLLDWRGEPFIRHVAKKAVKAGFTPVIIVLGAVIDPIASVVKDLPVEIVINPQWEVGQSGSMRLALTHLGCRSGGAVFMMSDIPHVPERLLQDLIRIHCVRDEGIIAPRFEGHRVNPVLFDRALFQALATVEGDRGGRALFDQYPVYWLDCADPLCDVDIDTPQDYQRLLDWSVGA